MSGTPELDRATAPGFGNVDSLSSGPIANLFERLHREAEAADGPLMQEYAGEEASRSDMIGRFIESETKDLKGVYHGLADNFLNVSPQFGRFLYMCARACKAKRIVEFGTSIGISTISIATALRDIGSSRLIGT